MEQEIDIRQAAKKAMYEDISERVNKAEVMQQQIRDFVTTTFPGAKYISQNSWEKSLFPCKKEIFEIGGELFGAGLGKVREEEISFFITSIEEDSLIIRNLVELGNYWEGKKIWEKVKKDAKERSGNTPWGRFKSWLFQVFFE